mmetsp:Transcript_14658/g.48116  ORF Transcript_14658/g.48116 Transcript_14658/m.48116 type:complete len:586 (+) Transcript_14658:2658-4415(+)
MTQGFRHYGKLSDEIKKHHCRCGACILFLLPSFLCDAVGPRLAEAAGGVGEELKGLGLFAEEIEGGGGDMAGGETREVELEIGRAVRDVHVGERERPHLEVAVEVAVEREVLEHVRGEAADGVLFDGDEDVVVVGELLDELGVEGFAEAGVGDGALDPEAFAELRRGGEALVRARAVPEEGAVLPFPQHHPLANLPRRPFKVCADAVRGEVDADAVPARVAERGGHVVDGGGGGDGVAELSLVRRRHNHHVRERREVSDVVRARVGRAVGAHEPGAVHREAHGDLLQAHVVRHLVVRALQKGAVDGGEGLEAFRRQARREGDCVLLRDADVERARGEHLLEDVEPRAPAHRCVHRHHLVVPRRLRDERVGEKLRVRVDARLGLVLLARHKVKLRHAVVLVLRVLRRHIPAPLLRHDVDQHRPRRVGRLHLLEDGDQVLQVVPVHGADVIQSKLLEQRRAGAANHAARVLIHLLRNLLHRRRHRLGDGLGRLTQLAQRARALEPRERRGERANRVLVHVVVLSRQRHLLVVVQDDHHVGVEEPGVVHRLVRHTARDGSVANHRHHVVVPPLNVTPNRHPEARGDAR